MSGIKKICFVAIVAVMLIAPAVNRYLVRNSPGSFLEGRARPNFPEITWDAVAEEKAQADFDAAITFGVPNRDEAMLVHARWQRRMIERAARLFGFDAWPTYYGSPYCRLGRHDAVAELPRKATPEDRGLLEAAARRYSEVMAAFPNVRWFFALVDAPVVSLAGPLHDHVNDPADYSWFRKHLLAHLPEACTVIDLGYDRDDDLYQDYFRTDHHWRIQGAIRAYGRIAEQLGIAPVEFGPPTLATAPEFFGSQSRQGLDADILGDAIFDVTYARSPLYVELNGIPISDRVLNYGYWVGPYQKKLKFEDMYSGYFHSGWEDLRIFNKSVTSGSLLIVGGSHTQCFERFFGESYREVYKLDPRFTRFTLARFLETNTVNDILFLFSPGMAAYEDFSHFFH